MKNETNTVLAVFEDDSEARKAYGAFHKAGMGNDYIIQACALYTKDGYNLKRLDSFSGAGMPVHHALFGWMIGALAGVFFGWKGLMAGALIGMVIGVFLDDHAMRRTEKCLRKLAASLPASHSGIVLIADETGTEGINAILEQYSMRAVRSRMDYVMPGFRPQKAGLRSIESR